MNKDEILRHLLQRNERLKRDRNPWLSLWEEAMDFVCPQHGTFKSQHYVVKGAKRGTAVYDGTPESAKDVMVAGIYSGLTPDAYKWFRWNLLPVELDKETEVRQWIERCEDIAYLAINDSNFGDATMMAHEYQVSLGTQIKYCEYDPTKTLNFINIGLQDAVFAENRFGDVDTIFREFKWSARNAWREWGEKCPDAVKTAMQSGNQDEEFEFLHVVVPREDYDPFKADAYNMPYASYWISISGEKKILAEGGYRTFPYSVSRMYKMRGEVYGRGPAIKALQTMGVLNSIAMTNLVAGQRMVEPPLQVPEDGFNKAVDLSPGAHNFYRQSSGEIKPIIQGLNVPFGLDQQQAYEQAVNRWFHVDVFLALSQGADHQRTLGEVLELKQEKMLLLGPMIGRQKREHVDSDLDRMFSILYENGYFPRTPQIVLDYMQDMRTEYTSPLFLAQRRRDSDAVLSIYQKASLLAQATQRLEVLDVLDDDAAIRLIAEREVVPSEVLREPEDVEAIRQQRAQQQQAMQQMQEAAAAVDAAKSLGQTPMDPSNPTALTEAARALSGGGA